MIAACLFVAILLAIGTLLKDRFAIFDRIYIPASVIAGFLGLAVVQWLDRFPPPVAMRTTLADGVDFLRQWPGFLIAVVFSAMLLQRVSGRRGVSFRATGCEALMVWIIAMGQTAIGLLLTWLVIRPFYSVPNSFGMLIETGFAGGHGTAAAMGQIFATPEIAFPLGLDLGLLMATAGLVYGTVSGIVWINVMVRMGLVHLKAQTPIEEPADENPLGKVLAAEIARDDAMSGEMAKDRWHVARRFLLQLFWIAAAFAIGMTLRSGVGAIAESLDSVSGGETSASVGEIDGAADTDPRSPVLQKLRWVSLVGSFPLFIYTLIGGGIVGRALTLAGRGEWMDGRSGATISGWAMDLLVVAAITTLNLQAVATYWVPMTLLFLGGAVWSAVCLLVLSRRILPDSHWFELGLINYGMSTGTTATGFVLLRLVDPQLRTDAAKHYAFAAPLSAPMVGGGLVTIGLPLLLLQRVPIAASAVAISVFVAGLIVVAVRLGRNR